MDKWTIVSTVISVLAFLMSLGSWVYTFIHQRRRLNVTLEAHQLLPKSLVLLLIFENKSRLPISITRISLLAGTEMLHSIPQSVAFFMTVKNQGRPNEEKKEYCSTEQPINLGSLGAQSAYVFFRDYRQTLPEVPTRLTLELCTNRGKAIQTTLPRPDLLLKDLLSI